MLKNFLKKTNQKKTETHKDYLVRALCQSKGSKKKAKAQTQDWLKK